MIKKLLSIATLFLFVGSASAVAQVKIGYMDTQEVMSQLPAMQQVQKELNTFIQQKQRDLSDKATQYQDEVADYQSNQGSMSEQQKKDRERELTDLSEELEEFNQQIRLEIQQKREQLLSPVLTRMDNAIAAIAESQNLDFVLNKSTNNGESVLFYASENQQNITQQVLNRLQSSSQ